MSATSQQLRLLVACAMKTGSTYIAKALALYFGAERIEPVPYWGRLEQNLHEHLLIGHLDRDFVLQLHIKPHVSNAEIIRKYGLEIIYVWRNLGDVLVSFDDHIRNEDYRNPVCHVDDPARYLAMPVQHRYRYLIQHAIPWYLGFYLAWRRVRAELPHVRTHYEDLASDPRGYFSSLIRALGREVDEPKLDAILAARIPKTRFNKGVNCRSVSLVSEQNQRLLETMLLTHFEDLSELWVELPWRKAAEHPQSSLLPALARCPYNESAGRVDGNGSGLRIDVNADDFYFRVPGALLAPAAGKSARLRLVVRGDTGSVFTLHPDRVFSRRLARAAFQATGQVQTLELHIDPGVLASHYRLHCFNAIRRAGTGEILEAVKYEA